MHDVNEREAAKSKQHHRASHKTLVFGTVGVFLAVLGFTPLLAAAATTSDGSSQSSSALVTGSSANSSQTISLTFKELGLATSYSFAGNGSSVGIQLAVPSALSPTSMTGSMIIPPDFGTGTLVVQSGTTYVSSFQLPPNSTQQQIEPFSFSLVGTQVSSNRETFTISVQQAGGGVSNLVQAAKCGGSGILPLTITDLTANYSGSFASPTTIADFFPPVMTSLILYVPSNPTSAEEETVLNLAAGVVADYSLVPVAVTVEPWDGAGAPLPPSDPLARAIFVKQSSQSGITLPSYSQGNRVLVISGTSSTLGEQATLINSSIVKIVQNTQAAVVKTSASPTVTVGSPTFGALGISGTTTFSGTQPLSFNLDETQLGGVVTSMAVNLMASYSPLEVNAKGNVEASVNGIVLATQKLGDSGVLVMPFTIPAPLIARTTNVIVTATYFPVGFSCTSVTRTMTFTLDPRSTVTTTINPGGVGGFPSLPQALVPTFQVSFDQSTPENLRAAVATICGLQRISVVRLHPQVVPLSTSENNSQPLLVVARAQSLEKMFSMPLQYRGNYVIGVASAVEFRMKTPLAAIETFDDTAHNRSVLTVTTTGSWALTDGLFNWLGNTSDQWSSLTGDVLVAGPQGSPVNLTIRSGGPANFTATSNGSQLTLIVVAIVFAVAFLLLLATGAILLFWRRMSAE